jgi:polyisoprenoid-binding protein YceI
MAIAQGLMQTSISKLGREGLYRRNEFCLAAAFVIALAQGLGAQSAPETGITLQLDPAKSGADITLAATLHTVEGSFRARRGTIHYDTATGKADGEIVFDAISGRTGNDSRDNKMHKDVIESARFPEIAFRPDHADGTLARNGDSTLQVHGQFVIHGAEHEVTFPVQMHIEANSWSAKSSFTVPYAKWGMKNPSTLFLRVADEVKVELHAAGSIAVSSR